DVERLAPLLASSEIISKQSIGAKIDVDVLTIGCGCRRSGAALRMGVFDFFGRRGSLPQHFASVAVDCEGNEFIAFEPSEKNMIFPDAWRGKPRWDFGFPEQIALDAKMDRRSLMIRV